MADEDVGEITGEARGGTIEISIEKIPPTQGFDAAEFIDEIGSAMLRVCGVAPQDHEFAFASIHRYEQQWDVNVHAKAHESVEPKVLSSFSKKVDEHEFEFALWAIGELLRSYPTLDSWAMVNIVREPQVRITVVGPRFQDADMAA